MMSLEIYTWARFLLWFGIGFFVYFSYGIGHSHENKGKSCFPCIEFNGVRDEDPPESTKL